MYIHCYDSNNVQLSEGTGLTPLVVGPLNATNNEVSPAIPVTLKCEAGYATYGATSVSFTGASAARWSVCATENGVFGPSLSLPDSITTAGTVIYVKACAVEGENPSNDVSVDLSVSTTVAAV